jgi:hypothetical protein
MKMSESGCPELKDEQDKINKIKNKDDYLP